MKTAGGSSENCHRCKDAFHLNQDSFPTLPICPGAEAESFDALYECACGVCADSLRTNPIDVDFCGSEAGTIINGRCDDCIEVNCPAVRAACRGEGV
jgi:hypothetical protein